MAMENWAAGKSSNGKIGQQEMSVEKGQQKTARTNDNGKKGNQKK